MAWFNPRAVSYHSNPYLVEQSGAVGDTLYKLYMDARANKQEQEKQNELKRQFDTTFGENQRQFNANQALKEQEMANDNAYRQNSLKLQQDTLEETKRNNDLFDAYRNAQSKFDNNLNLQKFYLDQQRFKENQRQFNQTQARELNNDLDLAIKQKNMPVSDRKDIKNIMTALEQAEALKNYVNEKGGWDKFGGAYDRFKTLMPNISQDGANYNALASNFATSASEVLKGQGKFNYEKINEDLEPSIVGTNRAQSTLNETNKMLTQRADELIKLAEAQGFIGADEARANLNNYISRIGNKPKEQTTNDLFNQNTIMMKR
ncbi:hypothetical protein CHL_0996 [Campylobacter hyointestinalis subsp. lawsonii CCUG 27631]|uniref:hypothetical protein n=1 Tax=Campylobacter hyointestinalis TaxID=198 RepID=UPI0007C8FD54|nr:hypothetical protein [Campylobacter hyointestinalis]ANE34343.1 hypothetical protein CHL_0996 [Campylobacter hyointestinalis subsp. lawsonii CCUG 27631]